MTRVSSVDDHASHLQRDDASDHLELAHRSISLTQARIFEVEKDAAARLDAIDLHGDMCGTVRGRRRVDGHPRTRQTFRPRCSDWRCSEWRVLRLHQEERPSQDALSTLGMKEPTQHKVRPVGVEWRRDERMEEKYGRDRGTEGSRSCHACRAGRNHHCRISVRSWHSKCLPSSSRLSCGSHLHVVVLRYVISPVAAIPRRRANPSHSLYRMFVLQTGCYGI